ncbi:MAG: glycosyl hydrolase family 18 protein [Bacteroidota bacterium]
MKKLLLILLSIFVFSGNLLAQEPERIGIHQEHMLKYSSKENIASKFDISGKDIIPLKTSQAKALSKVVFGFLPDWEYNSGAHNNMHYDLLTHIACFDFVASSSGNITNPSGWPWTDVINTAHTNGTKVIMTVVNFNGNDIHTILTNSTSKNTLFANIKNKIKAYDLDGVNIDFEGINNEDEGSKINNFMSELTTYIHAQLPGKEVSFDGPAVNWGDDWDLEGLAKSVDHLFIMAYDYNGGWSNNTGAVSPLTHPSGGISVTRTLTDDYNAAKSKYPEKLILGVPYYGKHWKTSTADPGSAVTSYVGSTFYKDDVVNSASKGGYIWDNASQTSWYKWYSGGWNQIWSDNEQSLSKKYDLAIAHSLGGVGIWALNYDGNRSELWNLISTKFAGGGLSVDDSFIKSNIALYPNPSTGTLKIANPNSIEINKVEVFNLYGQKLKAGFYNNTIDFSRFNAGIYLIRIEDNEGKQGTFKIIKN